MSSITLKYYYDLMSQPSRALWILLKLSNTPFESKIVGIRKAEHLTPEYKENVNRFRKVPCIVESGFKLAESVAILRYLSNTNRIDSKWYPNEIQNRSRVDEYLEWQHNNTRLSCASYFQLKWLKPLLTGKPSDEKNLNVAKKHMEEVLNTIENIWLTDNKFLAGNEITAADIFATCEIEQTRITGYNPVENRPKLKAWMTAVRDATNPLYDEAHIYVHKLAKISSKL